MDSSPSWVPMRLRVRRELEPMTLRIESHQLYYKSPIRVQLARFHFDASPPRLTVVSHVSSGLLQIRH